jgi:pimeloyl-ACP methyl ester carboxylesterase
MAAPESRPAAAPEQPPYANPAVNPWLAAWQYGVDAWQRSVLFTDVMRQRGNQYRKHIAKKAPNVLSMNSELVLDGRCLERPVNYGLLRILPPEGVTTDPIKRPFLVVDPRAGHGPGIGGFKPESEIGVAIRAGHPCYFASFLPRPTSTQTVEDVMRAEARFLEEIIALHPEAEGKPVVVANCQAGWQIMMTAAMRPELFGPIIIAGAPLSYWAGWRGMNPMRYAGGLLGGSWLTALASDLGNGTFDGAWLVQNFENLNPSNTLWTKQYNLYANIDTETKRYLGFEKWWGGHVYLNGPEIQYIVDNLFIGNRLATAGLVTSDGIRIDLRNIQSPIIVFCSKGDNITPPPQALGWIPDLYQNDEEMQAHGQTIVYAVHESIGHLGIFVSGSVARKEHSEFASNIDMIDVLPPGIYEAEFEKRTPDTPNADTAGDYVMTVENRTLDDVRAIVKKIPEDDKRFATVSRISQINLGLYRSFVQPWVRASVTPQSAEWLQRMHPLRLPYELISDQNPWVASVAGLAEQVRANREPVPADNPFLVMQNMMSDCIESSLDIYQELRDSAQERAFMNLYGSQLMRDWAGLGARDGPARIHPGISPEHRNFVSKRKDELLSLVPVGGLHRAAIRMLLYVIGSDGGVDERSFAVIRRLRTRDGQSVASLERFKELLREQAMVMRLDPAGSLRAMPKLLSKATPEDIRAMLASMKQVLEAAQPLNERAQESLREMEHMFEAAARRAEADAGERIPTGNVVLMTPPEAAAEEAPASDTPAPRKRAAPARKAAPSKAAPRKTAAKTATARKRTA